MVRARLGRSRESGNPYVDGPLLARALQLRIGSLAIICGRPPACKSFAAADRIACDHMSGLLMRSHMTAAKMGFATRGPNIIAMSGTADGFLGVFRVLRSIDHTICSVSSKLRPQRAATIAAR